MEIPTGTCKQFIWIYYEQTLHYYQSVKLIDKLFPFFSLSFDHLCSEFSISHLFVWTEKQNDCKGQIIEREEKTKKIEIVWILKARIGIYNRNSSSDISDL